MKANVNGKEGKSIICMQVASHDLKGGWIFHGCVWSPCEKGFMSELEKSMHRYYLNVTRES